MTGPSSELTEDEQRRIWTAVATTPCGPLHADANWTPGEPCDNCADLADGISAYLFATIERILTERLAPSIEGLRMSQADLLREAEAKGAREALESAATDAEWKYRSMSFSCGSGTSDTTLHPVGEWLRERAAAIARAGGES